MHKAWKTRLPALRGLWICIWFLQGQNNVWGNDGSLEPFCDRSLFVCVKLKLSSCLSACPHLSVCLPVCLSASVCLSLSFHAVAREAGRMRSLAAAEGYGEKTEMRRKCDALTDHLWSQMGLDPLPHQFHDTNPGINGCKMSNLAAFCPLPYMAGQRYIVPVFNRLAVLLCLEASF